LYTAGQVRGIDYTAIHELGIPGYQLMCRAGAAVVADARQHYPATRRWLVLCGAGNNGGDGYVVARLAANAGIDVTVCSLVDTGRLQGDAARAHADWTEAGGKVIPWPLAAAVSCDLAFDALLGTGIDREVGGRYRDAIEWLNGLDCPRVAIDIASGINADTGCVMGCAVRAQRSVTFVGRKRGMYTADGQDYCGAVAFDDLGVPQQAAQQHAQEAGYLLDAHWLAERLKPRKRNTHKGHYGHVYAIGGIKGMSGAIRMCGEAALRSGAGLVTLGTDPAHAGLLNLTRPELMVKTIDSDNNWIAGLGNHFVIALGPGLGSTAWSELLFHECLANRATMVVDADGLNLLARHARQSVPVCDNWVLTPHPAEAARLLDCSVTDIQQDRVAAALKLAGRFGASVVLKGCGTVVADQRGRYGICPLGNPGMATGGSGDVLTGIIAALLGQGLDCFDAASAGVVAHAMAGDLAAEDIGETALLAGDIIDYLPDVWRSIAS
jgi:NAD(P)H-hydrate epimerase